jgi:hypothetical protein
MFSLPKKICIALIVFLTFLPRLSRAQFIGGSSVLGVHIGVSDVSKATVIGFKFEEGITEVGPGTISGSGKLDYYSWNAGNLGIQTFIFVTASANYHIKLGDGSLDPFFGLGVGYLAETNKFPDPSGSGFTLYNTYGSGFRFVFSLGARYFLSPNLALRLEFATSPVYAVGGFDFGF